METNKISICDLETKQDYAHFDGVKLQMGSGWPHLKEIPETRLLVSLHCSYYQSANMEVFDISNKGKIKTIYSFEEAIGSNIIFIYNQLIKWDHSDEHYP